MSQRTPTLALSDGSPPPAGATKLAGGDATGAAYAFFRVALAPGETFERPPAACESGYFVVKGSGRFEVGTNVVEVGKGDYLHVSNATGHRVLNSGGEPLEMTLLTSPDVFGVAPAERGAAPRLVGPKEGPCVGVVGDLYRFFATGEQTEARFSLWEATVPPGGGPPPHVHGREEECFYVLDGEVAFYSGDERVVAGPGSFVNMPPGAPHRFRNESSEPARMLIGVAPAGLELMFFETGVKLSGPSEPVPPPSPAEIERLLLAAPKFGVEIFAPKH